MAKYVLAYFGGGMPETPEEGEQVMAAWMNWFAALGDAVADGGAPFGPSSSVAADGTVSAGVVGGLTGYSVLNAADLAAAAELAKGCPILSSGGSVEVYETIDM